MGTAATGGLLLAASQAQAGDAVTYTYDVLGRLVTSSTTGTVNNGLSVSTGYDFAGNRSQYAVAGGTGPAAAPANQPPVAVNDAGGMSRCAPAQFAVLGNDYDPDGNTPLALVRLAGGGAKGTASIQGSSILFTPNGINGTVNIFYVMRDSLSAPAGATLTITITNGSCGPPL